MTFCSFQLTSDHSMNKTVWELEVESAIDRSRKRTLPVLPPNIRLSGTERLAKVLF